LFNKQFEKIDEQWRKKYIEEILVVTGEDGIREYGMGLRRVPEIIPQLVADQVKEKFGSLRFYHHGGDEYCNGAIELAEALSTCICENCGAPGTVGGRGWIKTLCTPCRTKIDAEQYDIHKDSNE
ncbi:MAG: hypothetical protein KGI25_09770, partial [Thaumarchaeota archaeon]|nr:hypothetical protein [Nitrososphaerota archaeon]